MVRGGLILLLVGALCAAVWFLLDDGGTSHDDAPLDDTDSGLDRPTLEGDPQPEAPPVTLDTIGDPVEFVEKLGHPLDEASLATLVALAKDPAFLAALIEYVKHPGPTKIAPNVSTTAPRWRTQAVHRALAAIGEPAAMALATEVDDVVEDVRLRVVRAIGAVGPEAARAVPTLLARIEVEESKYVMAAVVDAFGAMGPAASPALPLIHATLRDEDAEERLGLACARALVPIGGASAETLATIRYVLGADWYAASAVLIKASALLGSDAAPLVPTLLTLYDTDLGEDQLWGLVPAALADIGVASDDVIVFLRRTYWTAIEQGLWNDHVLLALARLGERGQDEVLAISASSDARHGRAAAVSILKNAGVDPDRLLTLLEPALLEGDALEQLEALSLMRQIGISADRLPWIEPFLEASDVRTRRGALEVLGNLSGAPKRVFDLLEARLTDADLHLQVLALGVIANQVDVDPRRALDLLRNAARSPELMVRRAALSSIWLLAKTFPTEVVATWTAALADPELRGDAAIHLATTGPATATTISTLVDLLGDSDPDIRYWAVRGLARTGGKPHVDAMFDATRDEAVAVRGEAVWQLGSFRKHAPTRIRERWIEALDDPQWLVYAKACSRLAELGAEAKDAIPKLEQLVAKEVPAPYYALAPEQALARIRAALGD